MRPLALALPVLMLLAPAVSAKQAARPQRVPKTERATMLASLKNFEALLEHSKDQLQPLASDNPDEQHDAQWYLDATKTLESDVTLDEDPDAARMDLYQSRYDKLKQGLVDHVYDGCPRCFNRDRRVAVRALQVKMDEAEVLQKKLDNPALKEKDRKRLEALSDRLDSMRASDLRHLRWDLGMRRAPLTEVATDKGERSFRDLLRKSPVLPTVPMRSRFAPPPPVDGSWRPNKWVSKANWHDYQRLVPWLQKVMDYTGTTALMQSFGIERPLDYTLALISTESSFFHGARSESGAHGFMQLLTPTARAVMRQNRKQYKDLMADDGSRALAPGQLNGSTLESDWKTNVFLGVEYLRQHVAEFGKKLAKAGVDVEQSGPVLQGLIAAAYNSGEGRVRRYWKRLHVALEDSSQSIVPFRETRKYVRKIDAMSEMNWVTDPS